MKKVVSLMLVLVLVLGMATMASAADSKSTIKIDRNSSTQVEIKGDNWNVTADGDIEVTSGLGRGGDWTSDIIDWTGITANADGKFASWGTTVAGGNPNPSTGLLKDDIRSAKVTLKTVVTKGAKAFDGTAEWEYDSVTKEAFVKVKFNEWFHSNREGGIEFAAKIYIVVDGRQWAESGKEISGDYGNITETYYVSSDGQVYMRDGTIIKADSYRKDVEMDLGEGVYAYGKMFKDRCYYGVADIDVYEKDADFFDKYEIDAVYHVNEAGLKAVVDYVKLENEDASSYVYYVENDKLVDSGKKGNDKLELRDVYYLSTKQLDVDEANGDEPEEDDGDDTELPAETGGDDYYPENVNDNPGTGR